MSGQIFISYRRDDASYPAGRLYDRLSVHFAQNQIFMDVDNLNPGVDFVEVIEKSVGSCDVLIAVIGKRWLISSDEEGRRRLDHPEDFVRTEIGTALKRGILVIPVLVEDATMPRSGELPEDLKALVRRNAVKVSHDRFRADSERLVGAVEQVLENARFERQRKREEQQRVEAERRHREEEERLQAEQRAQAERLELEHQQEEQARLRADRQLRAEQERVEANRSVRAEQDRLESEQRESERRRQEEKKRLEAESHLKDTPALQVLASLKKRWRLLVVVGGGVAVFLLGFGLFNRPARVSVNQTVSPANSSAELYAEAKRYLDAKDYTNALPFLQKGADAGNADAMNNLGYLYEIGKGVNRDYTKAREWYQKAADKGNAEAMSRLGDLYSYGWGVAQDDAQTREWYQKAADKGNVYAKQKLSNLQQRP